MPSLVRVQKNVQSCKAYQHILPSFPSQCHIGCDICLCKSVPRSEIDERDKSHHTVYPYQVCKAAEYRTKEWLLALLNDPDYDIMHEDDMKGVKGRTPLLRLSYFDPIMDIPVDHMHLFAYGMIKRFVQLTIRGGPAVPGSGFYVRGRVPPKPLNDVLMRTKCPSEFSRRTRELDISAYKGKNEIILIYSPGLMEIAKNISFFWQFNISSSYSKYSNLPLFFAAEEFRNLCLVFFPAVMEALKDKEEAVSLWLKLVYLYRAVLLPHGPFNKLDKNRLQQVAEKLVEDHEAHFTYRHSTYSLHMMLHVVHIRSQKGPFTEYSAYPFEGFYSLVRRNQVPGVLSNAKVIMNAINSTFLLQSQKHHCQPRLVISSRTTEKCDDSIVALSHSHVSTFAFTIFFVSETYTCDTFFSVHESEKA